MTYWRFEKAAAPIQIFHEIFPYKSFPKTELQKT